MFAIFKHISKKPGFFQTPTQMDLIYKINAIIGMSVSLATEPCLAITFMVKNLPLTQNVEILDT